MYARARGGKIEDFDELQPSDGEFIPLMNYRRYRFIDTGTHLPNYKGIARAKDNLKSLLPTKFVFKGDDPIMIFHFWERLASMADDLSINKRILFVILPKFLEGSARFSFESAKTTDNSFAGPVNDWPSAVYFFLKRYATMKTSRNH